MDSLLSSCKLDRSLQRSCAVMSGASVALRMSCILGLRFSFRDAGIPSRRKYFCACDATCIHVEASSRQDSLTNGDGALELCGHRWPPLPACAPHIVPATTLLAPTLLMIVAPLLENSKRPCWITMCECCGKRCSLGCINWGQEGRTLSLSLSFMIAYSRVSYNAVVRQGVQSCGFYVVNGCWATQ